MYDEKKKENHSLVLVPFYSFHDIIAAFAYSKETPPKRKKRKKRLALTGCDDRKWVVMKGVYVYVYVWFFGQA